MKKITILINILLPALCMYSLYLFSMEPMHNEKNLTQDEKKAVENLLRLKSSDPTYVCIACKGQGKNIRCITIKSFVEHIKTNHKD